MNRGWTYREQVDRTRAGITVLEYYTQRYRHSSETEWQERIRSGLVLLNDKSVTPETVLQPGQWLTYHRPPWNEPEVPLDFDVLYEDADLLVVDKPSGLPVLPGGGFLEHTLLWQLQQRYADAALSDSARADLARSDSVQLNSALAKPVPIHRLGRGTSGLLLLARSPLAKSHLSRQLRDRQMRKTYRALVGAGDLPDQFTIDNPIGKIPHPVLGYVYGATPTGQWAYSEGRVIRRDATSTLLEVTILTGRPHQIRIHLAAIGYPLLGDPLYQVGGMPRSEAVIESPTSAKLPVPGDCGYHLHAYQLVFTHPRTREPMRLSCPPPPALA